MIPIAVTAPMNRPGPWRQSPSLLTSSPASIHAIVAAIAPPPSAPTTSHHHRLCIDEHRTSRLSTRRHARKHRGDVAPSRSRLAELFVDRRVATLVVLHALFAVEEP